MTDIPDPWPLHGLVLRTPRLELRPDDDAGLRELAEVGAAGVHPPERMPFLTPWTDAPREELGRNMLQHMWSMRAALAPSSWGVNFLVRLDGRVIGMQGVEAHDFAINRSVSTGSWLGMAHQGQGIGTEMRAAVAQFAFDHLGARFVRSAAFTDNEPSLAVSRKLGYVEDGTAEHAVRGVRVCERRLLLTPDRFTRPQWTVEVHGLEPCRALLGAETTDE